MNYLAKEWVKALRSGDYKQTQKYLRDENGFCCLGVACDVAMKNGLELDVTKYSTSFGESGCYSYDGNDGRLPIVVMEALGIKSSDGYVKELPHSLARLNDTEALTFEQIADYIETNERYLFHENT